ncbi:ferrous iron transport protein A [Vibrio sp.]|uniref:Ferrous iron transport protein A n=1 Tax=Vibrio viridaestus TaxID=2487322 RepID=A0A3N9TJL8_9VIBR|nr:FeoA family protein [Vibrio viridaestus]MDC0611722.1 ferrous iron transport protein A [Vibrio sp.]RQW64144.1 ferrous iron transport protein A [Vibrio viridaestus]
MKLSHLKNGQSGLIVAFDSLSNDVRKRLMVMGILPNTEITVIRRAPMGDPLQVDVRGVSIAVRESIAASIEVEVTE